MTDGWRNPEKAEVQALTGRLPLIYTGPRTRQPTQGRFSIPTDSQAGIPSKALEKLGQTGFGF